MNVTIEKQDSKTLVTLQGRLDTTNAADFQVDIQPLMDDPEPEIEIDCTDMEYTSSQGLRLFLMLQKTVNSRKGTLVMKNMKPDTKNSVPNQMI